MWGPPELLFQPDPLDDDAPLGFYTMPVFPYGLRADWQFLDAQGVWMLNDGKPVDLLGADADSKKAKSLRILFIGSSFLHSGGVQYYLTPALLESQGVKTTVGKVMGPGMGLVWHYYANQGRIPPDSVQMKDIEQARKQYGEDNAEYKQTFAKKTELAVSFKGRLDKQLAEGFWDLIIFDQRSGWQNDSFDEPLVRKILDQLRSTSPKARILHAVSIRSVKPWNEELTNRSVSTMLMNRKLGIESVPCDAALRDAHAARPDIGIFVSAKDIWTVPLTPKQKAAIGAFHRFMRTKGNALRDSFRSGNPLPPEERHCFYLLHAECFKGYNPYAPKEKLSTLTPCEKDRRVYTEQVIRRGDDLMRKGYLGGSYTPDEIRDLRLYAVWTQTQCVPDQMLPYTLGLTRKERPQWVDPRERHRPRS